MKKYILSAIYFVLFVSSNLFAEDAEKAKKQLGFITDETLSTEKTYQDRLYQFLVNLAEHKAIFKSSLDALKGDAIKKLFSKSKIEALTDFDVNIAKVIANVKTILKNSVEITKKFTALANATKSADSDAMAKALNEIRNFFLDDQLFLQPYKEYFEKYEQDFRTQYAKLFEQYVKNGNFVDKAEQYLILPVQRGPRYTLLFQDLKKRIAEWATADKADKGLTNLKNWSEQLVETIEKKTKSVAPKKI